MWLVTCLEDRAVDLKGLGERLGAGRFSFGRADRLMTYLGVRPGAVTPFAVINDKEDAVTMVLDSGVMGDCPGDRSEEHTSELQSLMRISYAVICLKKKKKPHD